MIPASTPKLSRDALDTRLRKAGYHTKLARHPLVIVGMRGYYRDSMGAVGRNDRGIYDDALFVCSSNAMVAFNGNTDPSSYRKATASKRGMATLVPGLYLAHKIGLHKGYRALSQQMGEVTVARDGETALDTGYHGINIHRGAPKSTSSEGCQTIPPAQWPAFIGLVESEARRLFGADWPRTVIPYALLEGE